MTNKPNRKNNAMQINETTIEIALKSMKLTYSSGNYDDHDKFDSAVSELEYVLKCIASEPQNIAVHTLSIVRDVGKNKLPTQDFQYIKKMLYQDQTLDNEQHMTVMAAEIIYRDMRASTSHLQRKLRIGYNHAARIIDALEDLGVIGPQLGSEKREVFLKPVPKGEEK